MNVRRRRLSGDLEGERDEIRVVDDLDDEPERAAARPGARRTRAAGAGHRPAPTADADPPGRENTGASDAARSGRAGTVSGSASHAPVADAKADAKADNKADKKRGKKPLYPRLLRLQHIKPNAWQRAALGEGAIGVGVLLAMADLATAWGIVVIPLAVAAIVKAHDALQGLLDPRDRPDDRRTDRLDDQPTDRDDDATTPPAS